VLNALRYGQTVAIWSSEPLNVSSPWVATRTQGEPDEVLAVAPTQLSATRWSWSVPDHLSRSELVVGGANSAGQSAETPIVDLAERTARILPTPLWIDPVHPNAITEYSEIFARSCVLRSTGQAPEQDSAAQVKELLGQRLQPGCSVLDVGCAGGHTWCSLRELGLDYFGIDPYTRAIEIGRLILGGQGLPTERLRDIRLEDLPGDERYDAVICLSTLLYFPMFHEPLALMSRAAKKWLIVRSSFDDETAIRYLPDILLEPRYERLHAYFNIYSRDEVRRFLEARGFSVAWHRDRRQTDKFEGAPESVGGIELPYEFLVARRVRPLEDVDQLDEYFAHALAAWREHAAGGPSA
jgi:SAM-dependent methyltransferase